MYQQVRSAASIKMNLLQLHNFPKYLQDIKILQKQSLKSLFAGKGQFFCFQHPLEAHWPIFQVGLAVTTQSKYKNEVFLRYTIFVLAAHQNTAKTFFISILKNFVCGQGPIFSFSTSFGGTFGLFSQ